MGEMLRICFALLLLASPVAAAQTFDECVKACKDNEFPVNPGATKPFPHKITFENDSDQGNGSAAILFRTLVDADIVAVVVNGEAAKKGKPYKGCPVFLLSKPGTDYTRPLTFLITTKDGTMWSATSDSTSLPVTPEEYKNKLTDTSYGVRNGGRQAWRISKGGDELGSGPIKFVFSSGKTFIVKNPLKNCRDQESCSRNSKAPMYGFVYKPGIGPNGDGDDNTGTSHGGSCTEANPLLGDNPDDAVIIGSKLLVLGAATWLAEYHLAGNPRQQEYRNYIYAPVAIIGGAAGVYNSTLDCG